MSQSDERNEQESFSVENYLERADARLFWDYTLPRVLKLSLLLFCEHADKPVGLIFPLRRVSLSLLQLDVNQLAVLGESLVGWLKENETFYSFLTPAPFFEYADDYRLIPFSIGDEDDILLVIPRRIHSFTLPALPEQTTARRVLGWLRQQASTQSFALNIRRGSVVAPLPAHAHDYPFPNTIFNNLADMVVQVGGELVQDQPRWRFSCILLPKDEDGVLPLNQRTLLVYAQSTHSPHRVGQTLVVPYDSSLSVSLRAFLSGHVIYRPEVTEDDETIRFREIEGNVKSVFAMALNDERGLPRAVLYIGSDEDEAFSVEDQRILRLLGKLIEEAFAIYYAYQQSNTRLSDIIRHPNIIDPFFKDFLSENEFLHDISAYLSVVRNDKVPAGEEQKADEDQNVRRFSLVMVDLNNQSILTAMYGYQAIRNLSHGIGSRLKGLIGAHFSRDISLYHLYGSRFCFLLNAGAPEYVLSNVTNIWNELQESYGVSLQRSFIAQPSVSGSILLLNTIQIRAVVVSYSYQALQTIFANQTSDLALRAKMLQQLERGLTEGESVGGDVLLSWSSENQQFKVVTSRKDKDKKE